MITTLVTLQAGSPNKSSDSEEKESTGLYKSADIRDDSSTKPAF